MYNENDKGTKNMYKKIILNLNLIIIEVAVVNRSCNGQKYRTTILEGNGVKCINICNIINILIFDMFMN